MPWFEPDSGAPVAAESIELSAGSRLWRIHSDDFAAGSFNRTVPGPHRGGRFDSYDGSYAYLYAGADTTAAVAETLLRDRPPSGHTFRIPAARLYAIRLSSLVVRHDLTLVRLHGSGLSAIGQDAWLTSCGADEYGRTRQWAAALRAWAPWAQGLEWRARHDDDRLAYVFFEDRCSDAGFGVATTYACDRPGLGFHLVRRAAARHHAVVRLV